MQCIQKSSAYAHKKIPRMRPFSEHRPFPTDAHAGWAFSILMSVVETGREAQFDNGLRCWDIRVIPDVLCSLRSIAVSQGGRVPRSAVDLSTRCTNVPVSRGLCDFL